MAVLLLPFGIELQHASEDHIHNHCDITAEHFDTHDEDCSHLHFLSKVNAIDFKVSSEHVELVFVENQLFHYQSENTLSNHRYHSLRGPPFLLLIPA